MVFSPIISHLLGNVLIFKEKLEKINDTFKIKKHVSTVLLSSSVLNNIIYKLECKE